MTKQKALIYLVIIVVIYLIGAYSIDLMDNDATQYMTIAQNMHLSGDYMNILWRHDHNYLDKPPLLFWLSSFFFSIFGVNHFAYRLPSILINILGIFSTYKLGKRLYNEEIGLISSLVYATSLGIIIINHDVRTDTLLTGFVIFAIWQLWEYLSTKRILNFVLAFVGLGLAVSSKGPIGLMVPILAIGPQLLYQKRWKDIFRIEWLGGLLIVFIVLLPMIISTYNQHGLHGLEFHFWTQSFGRLTGENVWKDTTSSYFFLHTFLWSFLPWSFLAVIAYFRRAVFLLKSRNIKNEIITMSGITLLFIAMSVSQYKLPHYIFVVYPLFAIVTAEYIFSLIEKSSKSRNIIITQLIINFILWIAIAITYYLFSDHFVLSLIISLALFAVFVYTIITKDLKGSLLSSTMITIISIGLFMNLHFYPTLSEYQARVQVGKYIKEHKIKVDEIVIFQDGLHLPSVDVYSHQLNIRSNKMSMVDSLLHKNKFLYIFTNRQGLDSLDLHEHNYTLEETYKDFHISLLTIDFLNPEKRNDEFKELYLVKVRSTKN